MMDRRPMCTAVMLMSLAVVGCRQNERPRPAVIEAAPTTRTSTMVTLSADQLMALDYGGRAIGRSGVLDRRRAGAGVEFDIRFPGDSEAVCSIDYTSSGTAGRGALVGLDVGRYEAFALKFTLISVNARKDPNVPLEVAVGALIGPAGDGRLSACEPVVLGLSSEQAASVATTPMRTRTIRLIGIHAHVVDPQAWDSTGGIVTLRVEPAPDAEILPASVCAEVATVGPREESAGIPTFGTQRTGAW